MQAARPSEPGAAAGALASSEGASLERHDLGLEIVGRLPRSRALLRLEGAIGALAPRPQSDRLDVVLEGDGLRLVFGAESRLRVEARCPLVLRDLGSGWSHRLDRRLRGGAGFASLRSDEAGGHLLLAARAPEAGRLRIDVGETVEIQVFPPRRTALDLLGLRIAHEGRPHPHPTAAIPDDELVARVAEHADVFALHAYFWREEDPRRRPRWSRYRFRRCPWFNARHEPEDPRAFERLMTTVRARGMRFLPYLSPRYSTAPDLLAEIGRLQARWSFDGFYLDGLRGGLDQQIDFMRGLRRLLGPEALIYLNASAGPFADPAIPCPALDAWADLVLRGDAGRAGLDRTTFLREAVSGWRRSGSIGLWCHYGSSGLPLPLDRVPSPADVEAALAAHVRIWRRSFWLGGGRRLALFDAAYERGLEQLARAERAAILAAEAPG
ncbi:MAG: hypothetical protein H6807_16645 [Planctomycetes bacterium]|nr:hypothetical protein [Planctomycetota bacterium]